MINNRHGNTAFGAFMCNGPAVSFVNCTVVSNAACGIGIDEYLDNTVTISNSIVWYNGNNLIRLEKARVSFSCIDDTDITHGENGNITNNPLFANADAGDFRLQWKPVQSPCINTGTNQAWMTQAFDLIGKPRIAAQTVDMGAYEMPRRPKGMVVKVQ